MDSRFQVFITSINKNYLPEKKTSGPSMEEKLGVACLSFFEDSGLLEGGEFVARNVDCGGEEAKKLSAIIQRIFEIDAN